MSTVLRAFLRHLRRRRSLTLLQVLGVAFGVAAAVAMGLSARAALDTAERTVAFLAGKATHRLRRPAGPLDEAAVVRLMQDPAVEAFSPLVDRHLRLASGEPVRVLGVDPFLDRAFRPGLVPDPGAARRFLTEPGAVLLDRRTARRLGVAPGSELATDRGDLFVVGTFPAPAGEPLVLMDIAAAQERFGLRGRVDRVDLILREAGAFRRRWEPSHEVVPAREPVRALRDMLRAFRLNLEALSLLGLFVGVFLVYNTAMFAVVTRRRDAGVLRSLGAYPGEIARAFAAEVALLGACGGLAGAALGIALSRALTEHVGEAVSRVYFFLKPAPPGWTGHTLAWGVALGVGAAALGAAWPLRELLRVDPAEALRIRPGREDAGLGARAAGWAGLGAAAVSAALLFPAASHVYAGFAAAFALMLAAALGAGVYLDRCVPVLERLAAPWCGLAVRHALAGLRRRGRAGVAVAAFGAALSMNVGLGLLVGSFRHTLVRWMDAQLTAHLYVAPQPDVQIPPGLYEAVRRVPGVGGVDPYRNVRIRYRDTFAYVTAVDARVLRRFARFLWMPGDDRAWDAVARGGVIVSESFFRRFGTGPGGRVVLRGPGGEARLTVAAVYHDYTSEHGVVMMDRSTYLRIFGDPTIDSLGVFLEPDLTDAGRARALEAVRALARQRGLPVSDRRALHAEILEAFDTTFAVTRSMRWIAVIVAFFGIAGALTTLSLERQQEFGVLRALGFSPSQVVAMTLAEGLTLGLLSFGLGAASGTALGWLIIRVVNLQSFHWTVFPAPEAAPYATALATALGASAAAALYPAWRVWRAFPQILIREE